MLKSALIGCVGCASLLSLVCFTDNASAQTYTIDAPESGVELGLGWDSKTARLVPNRCIVFAPIQEGGQEATLSLSEVSDAAELSRHLGVSVSASIHGVGGSGSASAEFVENSKVSSTSTTFAVRAAVVNGPMFVGPFRPPAERRYAFSAIEHKVRKRKDRDPEPPSAQMDSVYLADWALEIIEASGKGKPTEFTKRCGDSFVSGIFSGVEMFSVITTETSNSETSREIKAAIEASYGVAAGGASVDAGLDETLAKSNTSMEFFQRGGAGGAIPTSPDALVAKVERIAQEAVEAPAFFEIQITPYQDLPGWPGPLIEDDDDPKDIIVERYLQLKTLFADLQDVANSLRRGEEEYDACFSLSYYDLIQDRIREALRCVADYNLELVKGGYSKEAVNKTKLGDCERLQLGVPRSPSDEPQDFLTWLENIDIARLRILLPRRFPTTTDKTTTDDKGKVVEKEVPGPSICADAEKYRRSVVDQYLRPMNDRLCSLAPSSAECLSNEELARLQSEVRLPMSLEFELGASGYLCSKVPAPSRGCVADRLNEKNEFLVTHNLAEAALVTVAEGSGGFILRVSLRDRAEPGTLYMGPSYKPPSHPFDYIHSVTNAKSEDPKRTELKWNTMPKPDTVKATTGGTINRVKYDWCLLSYSDEDHLLIYPNNCNTGDVRYKWELVDATEPGFLEDAP